MSSVLDLAKALISCHSVTPNDAGCQKIIRERLTKIGFTCEQLRFGEVDNLWARYGNQEPLFVFAGHSDVVPPGPLEEWQSPPFTPDIRDGILYGRGASDMKGAVAAMVIAAENFVKNHTIFPGSLALLITSDEEGPAIDGTKKVIEMLENRHEKINYCIVGEASSEKKVGDQIRIGRRGSLHGKLTIHGKQGHVAFPELAQNAIHEAMLALHHLSHTTWDAGNEFFPPTTFQMSNLHAGTGALNVIPGVLEAQFNFRFGTALSIEQIKQQAEKIISSLTVPFTLEWKVGAEPFLTAAGKLISVTKETIKAETGLNVILSTGGGTSDARFIANTGTEVIELGVPFASVHQIDEHVAVKDLEILVNLYQKILENIF